MASEQVDDISTEREWVDELFAELFKPACFVCKNCEKRFPTLDQVNAHMDKERHRFPKHKGPYYACVCQFCNEARSGPIELKRHIQEKEFKNLFPKEYRDVIAKQLDFPCVWCESRFKREEHCSRHELKECPDRPAHFQQEDDVQEVNDPANEDILQENVENGQMNSDLLYVVDCDLKECPKKLYLWHQEDDIQELSDPTNEDILQDNVENVQMNNDLLDVIDYDLKECPKKLDNWQQEDNIQELDDPEHEHIQQENGGNVQVNNALLDYHVSRL